MSNIDKTIYRSMEKVAFMPMFLLSDKAKMDRMKREMEYMKVEDEYRAAKENRSKFWKDKQTVLDYLNAESDIQKGRNNLQDLVDRTDRIKTNPESVEITNAIGNSVNSAMSNYINAQKDVALSHPVNRGLDKLSNGLERVYNDLHNIAHNPTTHKLLIGAVGVGATASIVNNAINLLNSRDSQ